MPITINGTTTTRIGYLRPTLGGVSVDFDGTYEEPGNVLGYINPTLGGLSVSMEGQSSISGSFDGYMEIDIGAISASMRGSVSAVDSPPVITSTPSPSFIINGIEQTYPMSQHVSDDGFSTLTYGLNGTLDPSLSFNTSSGLLTYDGSTGATNLMTLTATDSTGTVESSSFSITIADTATTWIGIPDPVDSFGYDPLTIARPSSPAEWPSAENSAFYYVDDTTGSDSNTYGTPNNPRATPPTSLNAGDTLIFGGGGPYNLLGLAGNMAGTQANPIFVIGEDVAATFLSETIVCTTGDQYVIFDNFQVNQATDRDNLRTATQVTGAGTAFICFRNIEHYGDGTLDSGGFGHNVGGTSTANHVHDIVYYQCYSHDMMDKAIENVDHISFVPHRNCDRVWILKCTAHDIAGDTIRTGSNISSIGTDDPANLVFIAGCLGYDNGENPGVDVKMSTNIIISQNEFHTGGPWYIESGQSSGVAVVTHNDATNVWVIFNEFHNLYRAVQTGTDQGVQPTDKVYVLGNIFHTLEDQSTSNSSSGVGVYHTANMTCYVVDNTFYNFYGGISSSKELPEISGNLFVSRVTGATTDYDIDRTGSSTWGADYCGFDNMLVDNLSFNTNFVEGAALLVNPAALDFELGAGSPYINANGPKSSLYDLFQTNYGLDIFKYYDGTSRVEGTDHNIGAFKTAG